MTLHELRTVMKGDTVVKVVDQHMSPVFHGEADIMATEIPDRYHAGTVIMVHPEYYKGWGKTGITVYVMP